MNRINYIFIILLLTGFHAEGQLISYGSDWNFYDNEQAPPNDAQGDSWIENDYDDGSWITGPAQLGYGDTDESTLINEDTYTAYFRKTINVTDPSEYFSLIFDLVYDDGAVVYVNGVEISRINMPSGTISYNTFASSTSDDNDTENFIIGNALVSGDNTIAVEIHQQSSSSSDLSFDLKVSALFIPAYLPNFNSPWLYYDNEQEPPAQGSTDWKALAFDDSYWNGGYGQLGYGDDDEVTIINDQTLTAYFRHTFSIIDPTIYSSLQLDLLYDDGAIVYLNGTEVWRVNMPTGTIDYSTLSSSQSNDNQTVSTIIANSLLAGENVITVEIHQRSTTSSDLSFDLRMTGINNQVGLPAFNSSWKYFDNEQKPANQGTTTWKESSYNDTAWLFGNGQLGYGDNDENTEINDNAQTTYFRHTFSIDDPTIYTSLKATLLYDDGGVVYLNGSEIMRLNMDPGDPAYTTFTNGSGGDNALSTQIIANTLVTGDNTLAVEIHQNSATSSDISFDFSLIGSNGSPSDVVRGPYLQKANDSGITIKWRTDLAAKGMVRYGTDLTNLSDSVVENSTVTEHEIDLINLLPATKYYYELVDSLGIQKESSPDLYFQTHPSATTDGSLTAWILGDCGTGNNNARSVRDAYYNYIGTEHTDMILFLGDNAYNDGTDQQYQDAIFENMYEDKLKNTVAWSCLGNHDGYSAQSSSQTGPYYDIFSFPTAGESGGIASGTEAYYSFDYGNVHFIVLDSYDSDRSVGGAMYNWCLSDIQNTTAKWIVSLWHHPPYTKGSHDSDLESNLIQMRERFLPILENNGVDLILSGHSHSYERSYYLNGHYGNASSFDSNTHTVGDTGDGDGKMNGTGAYRRAINGAGEGEGTVYITTGSAGKTSSGSLDHQAMFYSVSSLGSCILEINTDTLTVKFLRETGTIDDYFTITKCKGLESVENSADAGLGSMREMIANACDLDTILFDGNVLDPIVLQSEIVLDKTLYFKSLNQNTIISGDNTHRIFNILSGTVTEIEGLTLINSFANSNGGALVNNGTLILKNAEFDNNKEGGNDKAFTNFGTIRILNNSSVLIKE
ncbi:MAG: metallophosphoesterase [Saprospiraceae bacterium]|nr:metallophosphoesterase [Saprospiraceae bacterium]